MSQFSHFANLGTPSRVWAVSAVNGHVARLNALHTMIWQGFQPGDKIVYLGNYLGNPASPDNPDVIDAITLFKNALLAENLATACDIVCLKGTHEEMWLKLLQLQFANRPIEVLNWLLDQGLEGLLNHYGSTGEEGLRACRSGLISLTKWTQYLRGNMREKTGHEDFFRDLKRAAYSYDSECDSGLLFVHAGLDPNRTMLAQNDSFWWGADKFDRIEKSYDPFKYVIRGHDPQNRGFAANAATISLNGRFDQGGPLLCARLSSEGEILGLHSK